MKTRLLLLCFILISSLINAQIANGLVADYSFNTGDATDQAGSNDGTVFGATLTTDRFGNANSAYYFDGITNYISLGSSSIVKQSTGTISVWVNIDAISNTGTGYAYNPIIVCKNDQFGGSYFEGYAMYVAMNDNKIAVINTESQTSNEKYMFSNSAFSNDSWHHIVMAYDNDSLWFYSNGQLEGKILKSFSSTFSASEIVSLGTSNSLGNNRFFNGGIDDVRFYNRVLSSSEVNELFNEENPLTASITENIKTNKEIQIYPNPASSSIQINVTEPTAISIYSVVGEVVSSFLIESKLTIDLSSFKTGVYFLKDEKSNKTVKFIKK
jgi:hypothetical protein